VLRYAFHEGVDICVLTTGYEWWLYLPREKGSPKERRFAKLDITEGPPEARGGELKRFLSRSALVSGAAEGNAQHALRKLKMRQELKREAPEVWKKMWSEPDLDLIRLVTKRVRENTELAPTQADVAAALGMGRPDQSPGEGPGGGQPVDRERIGPERNRKDEKPGKPRAQRPTGDILFGERQEAVRLSAYAMLLRR